MANKSERIQSLILKNISEIIQFEVKNTTIGFVTVNDVVVNNDFSRAKVYVSFLGKGQSINDRLEALNRTKGFVRSELAKRMDIHKVPELFFYLDETYYNAMKLEESLKREEEKLNELKKK